MGPKPTLLPRAKAKATGPGVSGGSPGIGVLRAASNRLLFVYIDYNTAF